MNSSPGSCSLRAGRDGRKRQDGSKPLSSKLNKQGNLHTHGARLRQEVQLSTPARQKASQKFMETLRQSSVACPVQGDSTRPYSPQVCILHLWNGSHCGNDGWDTHSKDRGVPRGPRQPAVTSPPRCPLHLSSRYVKDTSLSDWGKSGVRHGGDTIELEGGPGRERSSLGVQRH